MPAKIRTSSGELTQFLRGLEKEGYEVCLAQSGHYQIRKDDVLLAVTSASPRDPHHAVVHTQRALRKALKRQARKPEQRDEATDDEARTERERHRELPRMPTRFEPAIPVAEPRAVNYRPAEPRFVTDEEVAQSRRQRQTERMRKRSAYRICDGCATGSGDDTYLARLLGSREQVVKYLVSLDPDLTPRELATMTGRMTGNEFVLQVCEKCAEKHELPHTAMTFGQITDLAIESPDVKVTVPGIVLSDDIPVAFRRNQSA